MIITEFKPFEEVLDNLNKDLGVFVIGCAACATKCQTGGEKEVNKVEQMLKEKGYKIIDKMVLDTPCDERIIKKDLLAKIKDRNDVQILVCACGSGVQTIKDLRVLY